MIKHPIEPVYDSGSEILILGSFPSVTSRKEMFFYSHPRNRFWRVLAAVLDTSVPQTVGEKRQLLLDNGIALWDVVAACEIEGSADSSIKKIVPNDLNRILQQADICKIFVNGKTAEKYYDQHVRPVLKREAIYLPSTSAANAAWSLERLIQEWSRILQK